MDFINEQELYDKTLAPAIDRLREAVSKLILEARDRFKDAEISVDAFDIKIPAFKIRVKILGD